MLNQGIFIQKVAHQRYLSDLKEVTLCKEISSTKIF